MEQALKEKLVENIISKLKENVADMEQTMLPVDKKIHNLIQIIHNIIEKNPTDQDPKGILSLIVNELENIADYYTHNFNIVRKNYNTYLYVLESMYNEYSKSISETEMTSRAPTAELQPHEMSNELAVVRDEKPKAKSEVFKLP